MAKRLLRLFGGLGIVAGLAVSFFGFEATRPDAITTVLVILPIPGGCFTAGALVLGFAEALDLLEKIERNSRESRLVGSAPSQQT